MYCTCIVHYISDAVDLATRIQASRTLGYALMNTDCTELFRTGTVFLCDTFSSEFYRVSR